MPKELKATRERTALCILEKKENAQEKNALHALLAFVVPIALSSGILNENSTNLMMIEIVIKCYSWIGTRFPESVVWIPQFNFRS